MRGDLLETWGFGPRNQFHSNVVEKGDARQCLENPKLGGFWSKLKIITTSSTVVEDTAGKRRRTALLTIAIHTYVVAVICQ